jgi:hypothetical protein
MTWKSCIVVLTLVCLLGCATSGNKVNLVGLSDAVQQAVSLSQSGVIAVAFASGDDSNMNDSHTPVGFKLDATVTYLIVRFHDSSGAYEPSALALKPRNDPPSAQDVGFLPGIGFRPLMCRLVQRNTGADREWMPLKAGHWIRSFGNSSPDLDLLFGIPRISTTEGLALVRFQSAVSSSQEQFTIPKL